MRACVRGEKGFPQMDESVWVEGERERNDERGRKAGVVGPRRGRLVGRSAVSAAVAPALAFCCS